MSTPVGPVRTAISWHPGSPTLGGAPRDGDFARLLEAASSPAAHRMDPEAVAAAFTGESVVRRATGTAPYGPPGMVRPLAEREHGAQSDDAAAPAADGFGHRPQATRFGGAPDPSRAAEAAAQAARTVATRWSQRPMRDRVVFGLFALAALFILGSIVSNLLESSADGDLGALLVLALIAFFVLRGFAARARKPPAGTP